MLNGYIVGNGDGTKWRTWGSTGPEWTEDREQATRYARRVDAERVHAEDDDAWRIVPFTDDLELWTEEDEASRARLIALPWDKWGQSELDGCAKLLAKEQALADVRHRVSRIVGGGAGEDAVEAVAQWLHDEGGFGDSFSGRTWPEHPDDTGQREGGWVKLVPSDVQAKFRDVARRLLTQPAAAALNARQSGEGAREALPRLDEGLIIAAMQGHYGKSATHIDGVDLTVNGYNWSFREGFKRMWSGVRKELNRRAALRATDDAGGA